MTSSEDIFAGKALRKLRIEKKMSLRSLASELDICYESVNRYEKGQHSMNLKRVSYFSHFFNVEPNVFFKDFKNNDD